MPKEGFSPEQIAKLLRQIEVKTPQGKLILVACREARHFGVFVAGAKSTADLISIRPEDERV